MQPPVTWQQVALFLLMTGYGTATNKLKAPDKCVRSLIAFCCHFVLNLFLFYSTIYISLIYFSIFLIAVEHQHPKTRVKIAVS